MRGRCTSEHTEADRRRNHLSSDRRSRDTGRRGGAPRHANDRATEGREIQVAGVGPHDRVNMSERKGFPLRLDPEIYDALQRWAASEFRSVNGQIEYLLRCALKDAGRLPQSDEEAANAKKKRPR